MFFLILYCCIFDLYLKLVITFLRDGLFYEDVFFLDILSKILFGVLCGIGEVFDGKGALAVHIDNFFGGF
jgi:hypothetical protein